MAEDTEQDLDKNQYTVLDDPAMTEIVQSISTRMGSIVKLCRQQNIPEHLAIDAMTRLTIQVMEQGIRYGIEMQAQAQNSNPEQYTE